MTDPDTGPAGGPAGGPDRGLGEARLRALLEDAVADVRPAPALDRIRSRTKVTPMRRTRPWLLATAGAVAATAATITVVSLADGSPPRADPGPGPAATSTEEPSDGPSGEPDLSAAPEPSTTPSTTEDPDPGEAPVALPVYFVGDTPTGPRLFREFRPAPAGTVDESSARLLAALQLAVGGDAPEDPDYRSGWPAGFSVVGAGDAGDVGGDAAVQVALDAGTDLTTRPAGMSEPEARLALQQLVHTAQAVLQQRQPVRFTGADGTPLTRLLGVDLRGPVQEAPAMEVQAPVWVISPQQGEEVDRTFTVEGRGAFFEANVSWQLLRDGAVVKDGFATAQECCTLSPYSFEVTAEPGEYVLRVYDADMSDGEGPGEQEDTKVVTVR